MTASRNWMSRRMIFLDTETTSLRPDRRIWDLAYIIRDVGLPEVTRQAYLRVDLAESDLQSLLIGGFFDRHPRGLRLSTAEDLLWGERKASDYIFDDFQDAVVVGAVPWFDTEALAGMLRRNGLTPTWHYHLVDVETLAAGRLGLSPPWDFNTVLARFGLQYDEAERHTALGDARMARDLFDKVLAS